MATKKATGYTSIRSILIVWFILFSVIPLALVAWYSIVKFQKAIEGEQFQRLKSNGREIEVAVADYNSQMKANRDYFNNSPHFTYNISMSDKNSIKEIAEDWMRTSAINKFSIYNRDGKMLCSLSKSNIADDQILDTTQFSKDIETRYMMHLYDRVDVGGVNQSSDGFLDLNLYSKITNSSGRTLGYITQTIVLRNEFLNNLKDRLKIEIMLFSEDNQMLHATFNPESDSLSDFLKSVSAKDFDKLYELKKKKTYYGFIFYPIIWDRYSFYFAIGASKKESQYVLSSVNLAFMGVIGLVILFLLVTSFIGTALLLRPINQLIEGIRAFEKSERPVQINISNRTEFGLLIGAFNQMSLKIFQTRKDLNYKIKELERANINLKEAQTKLVQSAKMTSLGQLVAGVAHELNNPIGFIYSNVVHLKEYTDSLFKIIDEIGKNPELAEKIKETNEYEYIKQDLPRLINSYQDGAQRTRDIVIGLRNFSRIEESQIKEINIHDALDTTLDLIKGEINTRVKVHRNYGQLPFVNCFASQINQVFMNVLSNAVQAIPEQGQIWITTSTLKSKDKSGDRVQISIQDTGTGMSAEVAEKIFEPFFTTKDVGQGTGLGLSISYGIIQNHGGDIQVRSEKGVGTEFVITIPISPQKKLN